MVKSVIASVCLIVCIACSDEMRTIKEEPDLVFNKLLGTWKLANEDQFEQWTRNDDGSYSSRVFVISGKDTNMMEEVRILNEAGKWNFVTLVKGQNKGKAITFTSSLLMDTLVQFENPAHDFPRIINYQLTNNDNMQAFIGGTTDTIYFNFTRVVPK
jgi:hypothetical protein